MIPKKVLLVEDDPAGRAVLKKWLERTGYEVETANTVCEATDKPDYRPALIVLDWWLPDGSGRRVAEHFRALDPSVFLLFISGMPSEQVEADLESLKPYLLLEKPFSFSGMRALMAQALA